MPVAGPTTSHFEIRHWAATKNLVPAEIVEHSIDHNPAILQLLPFAQVSAHKELRSLTWEEFFIKFDALGLAFVYDNDSSGYHEILQIEEKSPYRHPEYRPVDIRN